MGYAVNVSVACTTFTVAICIFCFWWRVKGHYPSSWVLLSFVGFNACCCLERVLIAFGQDSDISAGQLALHTATIALSLLTAAAVPFATQFMIALPTPKEYHSANVHLARAVCELREKVGV